MKRSSWHGLLIGVIFLVGVPAPARGVTHPLPGPTPTVAAIPLQIVLRTVTGVPVPDIRVDLVPVPPDEGGSPTGSTAQIGTTDSAGRIPFSVLPGIIWRARFSGVYQGRVLQAGAAQGLPPFGTTRGAGFVVQTGLQEENDAPAPIAGQPAPAVETLPFVLLAIGDEWTPAIDLA